MCKCYAYIHREGQTSFAKELCNQFHQLTQTAFYRLGKQKGKMGGAERIRMGQHPSFSLSLYNPSLYCFILTPLSPSYTANHPKGPLPADPLHVSFWSCYACLLKFCMIAYVFLCLDPAYSTQFEALQELETRLLTSTHHRKPQNTCQYDPFRFHIRKHGRLQLKNK